MKERSELRELQDYENFRVFETDYTGDHLKLSVRKPTLAERFEAFKLFLRVFQGVKREKLKKGYLELNPEERELVNKVWSKSFDKDFDKEQKCWD